MLSFHDIDAVRMSRIADNRVLGMREQVGSSDYVAEAIDAPQCTAKPNLFLDGRPSDLS